MPYLGIEKVLIFIIQNIINICFIVNILYTATLYTVLSYQLKSLNYYIKYTIYKLKHTLMYHT